MNRDKIIYWAATGLVAAAMLMSALMYFSKNEELMNSFETAGYPEFMVMILGTAKLLGAIALVIPILDKLKEWAYAGFTFVFIGAIWTHLATNTPWVAPAVMLAILAVSYTFRLRLKALVKD